MKTSISEKSLKITAYIVSFFFAVAILYPLFYIASNSLKDNMAIYEVPPSILPDTAHSMSIEIDYTEYKDLPEEELLDKILQENVVAMFSVLNEFNEESIYEMKIYGTIDDKTVFYSRAHKMLLQLQRDFGVYAQSVVKKKVLLYGDRYLRAMEKIGYEFDLNGLTRNFDKTNSVKGELDSKIAAHLTSEKFGIEGEFEGVIKKKNNLLLLENFKYYYQLPSYAYPNNERISRFGFFAFMGNTVIIIVWAILTQTILCSLSAYPLSKMLSAKKANIVLMYFLATMMIPFISIMIPQFTMFKKMGFYNNYEALLLPFLLPYGFFIYLYKGFFDKIPKSLFEAAKIDGASNFYAYMRICMPLSKPIISLIALQTFLSNWNDFFWAWMVTESQELWTLNVALYNLSKNYAVKQNFIMGLSILTIVPVILLTIGFSNQIKQSVASSGIKG